MTSACGCKEVLMATRCKEVLMASGWELGGLDGQCMQV